MFDALEQKFKNTEQADLISRLYEGKLKDYVKCLEVSYINYCILFLEIVYYSLFELWMFVY